MQALGFRRQQDGDADAAAVRRPIVPAVPEAPPEFLPQLLQGEEGRQGELRGVVRAAVPVPAVRRPRVDSRYAMDQLVKTAT